MLAKQVVIRANQFWLSLVSVGLVAAFCLGLATSASVLRAADGRSTPNAVGSGAGDVSRAAVPGLAATSKLDTSKSYLTIQHGVVVPGVAGGFGSSTRKPVSAASRKAFHLTKTCIVLSSVQNQCEVTSSTFGAIPAGTQITYDTSAGPTAFVATITIKNGKATGRCDILAAINDATKAGHCTFKSGTGRLTQFHLTVAVTRSTTVDWNPWFWDGTYWFGGSD